MFRRTSHDRSILVLAIPAFVALIAEPLYVLTDTAIVGHISTEALAGLAVAAAILLTVYSMLIFLAYGTTGIVGRLLGSGQQQDAAAQGIQAVWLAIFLGAAATAGIALFSGLLVDLFEPSSLVRRQALTYLRISLVGLIGQLIVMGGTGYLRGLQDTRTPLVVALTGALTNLGLELVLVFVFDLGIAGSAWSTVIAQWLCACAYVRVIFKASSKLQASIWPNFRRLVRYATVGFHLFIRTSALRASFLLAAALAARKGTTELAAHQIGIEVWSLLALGLDSVAIAGQALIAKFLGASEVGTAKAVSRRMIGLSIQIGCVGGAVLLAARSPIAKLFTNDVAVAELAGFLLVFVALTQPLNALVFGIDGILIGAGDLRFLAWAMISTFAGYAGIALATANFGMGWLWACLVALMIFRGGAVWARFTQGGWIRVGAD